MKQASEQALMMDTITLAILSLSINRLLIATIAFVYSHVNANEDVNDPSRFPTFKLPFPFSIHKPTN